MRSVYVLFLLVFYFSGFGQIINFPDSNFKNALLNTNCVDTNGDGTGDADADVNNDNEIDIFEADQVSRLIVGSQQINSLNGIEYFKDLIYLDCSYNFIISLDVNSLTKLEVLNCQNNRITSLLLNGLENLVELRCGFNKLNSLLIDDFIKLKLLVCEDNWLLNLNVDKLINLEYLICRNNKISTLNTSNLKSLIVLNCSNNLISSLNIGAFENLTNLECGFNKIQSINLDSVPNLMLLFCDFNNLSSLELKNLKKLLAFSCAQNQLSSLDISNTKIGYFICSDNQLKYLNIKNGIEKQTLLFDKNSDLSYICCDEQIVGNVKNQSVINGQNCEVNSYCTFTPGGKFYSINGDNKYDENKNGCDDIDIKLPYLKYTITNGNVEGNILSNSTGNYSIPVQEGTHILTPVLENSEFFEISPPSLTVTFPGTSDTITQNFYITPKEPYRQVDITIIPLIPPARPGFDAQYKIIWENKGNLPANGIIHFTYDEIIFDYVSANKTPVAIDSSKLSWDYTDLLPFEKREVIVTLNLNSPMENPPVNAGDITYLYANILDNVFRLENVIVGSYDPNDKTCLQGQYFHPDSVGKYVDFLIRFENTGNFAAENVVIKDIIDDKTFDVSSLLITDASHEVYTRIVANKVEFIFENIQLPFEDETNDGYVAFKIKTKSTLKLGDEMKNLADIYFDYNFPIRTNETQTTIAIPSGTKDVDTDVTIYPNPVRDVLTLDSSNRWTKAESFDISGRLIKVTDVEDFSVDVSGLDSGTYILHLSDKDKRGRVKFVKM